MTKLKFNQLNLNHGFSLIEIMLVIAIIAIIATIAMPSQIGAITQKRMVENIELVEPYKAKIAQYYRLHRGNFPSNNVEAGIPEAQKIIGNYLRKVEINNGVLHLYLGNKLSENLHNKILSIQPVYVEDSPSSPISWICGYDQVPTGMKAAGLNLTDLDTMLLPGRCR